jgi:hypothetical protein
MSIGWSKAKLEASSFACKKGTCQFVFKFADKNALPKFYHKYSPSDQAYVVAFKGLSISRIDDDLVTTLANPGLKSISISQTRGTTKFLIQGPKASTLNFEQSLKNKTFSLKAKYPSKGFVWSLKSALKKQNVAEQKKKQNTPKKNPPAKPLANKPNSVKEQKIALSKVIPEKKDSLDDFYKSVSTKASKKVFTINGEKALIVTKNALNIYAKASKRSETLTKLKFGEKLTMLQIEKQGWVRVLFKGRTGFVQKIGVRQPHELSKKQSEKLKTLANRQKEKMSKKDSPLPVRESKSQDILEFKAKLIKDKPTIVYTTYGRRDPFVPLEQPEVDGISIDEVQLVGIIWDESSPLAIFEDVRKTGISYTLKPGDIIVHGFLESIKPHEVVFSLTEFGVTHKYVMELPIFGEE